MSAEMSALTSRQCSAGEDCDQLPAIHWAYNEGGQMHDGLACIEHTHEIVDLLAQLAACVPPHSNSIEMHSFGPDCAMPGSVWCSHRGTCHYAEEDC